MGFRERPEYQDWRDAVFRLFGRTCIRCGHVGNIHAHHVMPVEDYPELAFEPTNGVPLCGNCHVAIKGNELAHAADLKRRQYVIMGGNTPMNVLGPPSEPLLRKLAFTEPSDAKAVGDWLDVADAKAVDEENVGVVAQIAHCFSMEGNQPEAMRMATHGLTLVPENEECKRILNGS